MVLAATIDTLEISKKFEKAGFEKLKAEALAEIISEVQTDSRDELATKQDVKLVENKIEQEFKLIHQEFKLIRSEIRNAMLTTIISIVFGLGGIIALIEKFIK